MGVWREGAGWCFCSGGDARSERLKAAIFSAKSAAVAAVSGQGQGSGLLIHRNLLLTTHGNLPSAAAAEDAEALLGHGRLAARLEPHRFFITSSILDLTIVGLDYAESDSTMQQGQQPQYLKTCCKPSLDHGSVVYLLGHTGKNELVIGEGKVVIGTDNLIKLATDGVTWCPGSAGFDTQGNLAFMICDPMKLASSPTARSSSVSSSSSHSWKKDHPMQFGIPISVVCDWLYQHWQGSLDEVSKPKLPLIRLMSSRSDHSSTSFTRRHVFKPDNDNDDASVCSKPKHQQASGSSATARISHEANPLVDMRTISEQGIATPEIYESPRRNSGQAQKDAASSAPKTIFLPLPLKQMLSDENNAEMSKPRNQSKGNGFPSGLIWHRNSEADCRDPPVTHLHDDCSSEGQSSSSPVEMLEYGYQDHFSSEEETMYSAETMESRNIPSPREKHVGRSQSCVTYSRWSSPRSSSIQNGSLRKQHTLIPVRKTNSQNTPVPQRSHDYLSPTVSSAMKKRNSVDQQQPTKPRRSTVQSSPKWMF
ncbi:hypothetical protein PR202_ga08505 [Eleusine coracana subsp. coracana]|uniref:Uncharacterized protein n=1 Tax=Eleusine coracana subsp. coracana TaxID=191504 RepID=A0AAV5C1K8_ELECO|nr:hypothetical protein QOZ80_1AG0044380 [Eleusine coracana subsp. coracana]GJM92077.1 hypothetical protein PR202_ga08505 [Eleusine coracana subsp. coracana]